MSLSFSLKTHRPGIEYSGVHFFVLNRGENSGKPLVAPCPNCFVCECSNDEDKEALYWIFFALWQSHKFRYNLIGSVILYMRKKEMIDLVRDSFLKTQSNPELFQKTLILLKTVNEKDLHFQDLAATLKKMKRAVAMDLVR